MPISSLIVRTKANETNVIADQIRNTVDHTEVSNIEGDNIVVLTDTATRDEDKEIWGKIESIPGVLKVDLIYHNFEDLEEENNG